MILRSPLCGEDKEGDDKNKKLRFFAPSRFKFPSSIISKNLVRLRQHRPVENLPCRWLHIIIRRALYNRRTNGPLIFPRLQIRQVLLAPHLCRRNPLLCGTLHLRHCIQLPAIMRHRNRPDLLGIFRRIRRPHHAWLQALDRHAIDHNIRLRCRRQHLTPLPFLLRRVALGFRGIVNLRLFLLFSEWPECSRWARRQPEPQRQA